MAGASFVTRFRFLIFKIFSFQDNLKSKLRHAVLLRSTKENAFLIVCWVSCVIQAEMCTCSRIEASFHASQSTIGCLVNDLCFLPDNVFSVGCIFGLEGLNEHKQKM